MNTCTCCTPAKSYTELKNLYRHQRKNDPLFIEPRDRYRVAYEHYPKQCLNCSDEISFLQHQANGRIKFCSHSCAALFNNPLRSKPRNCQVCDTSMTWRDGTYCSRACAHQDKQVRYIKSWLAGHENGRSGEGQVSVYIRRHLLEQAGHKCSECGWCRINPATGKSPLNVDHIDGDSTNNRPENLRVLCPNCHSITPTYGSLNKGKGREARREYRKRMKESGKIFE